MRRWGLTLLTLAALGAGGTATAAGIPPAATSGTADDRRDALDGPLEARRTPTLRVRFAWPQQAAFAPGILFHRQPADFDCRGICSYRGAQAQVEVGTGGVQVAAGWSRLVGETDEDGMLLNRVYMGFGVRGALLRTFAGSPFDPEPRTLAGVEGAWTAARISLTLAVYRSVDGRRGRFVVGGGVGWGF